MSYIGRQNLGGAYRQLDDISSGFDGSDTTHTMQVNSQNVTVGDVNQIILSLGGVIQKPGTDFTVSGSVLTFTTAPAANTSFFAVLLGSDNGGTVTPTDGSVTGDKLASNIAITTSGDTSLDGGSFVFNESSADKDFRVESNGNTHMLFVDGGDDDVRIGTATAVQPGSGAGLGVKGDVNISDFANDTSSSALVFTKSRNTTPGSQTIVNNGDQIGAIFFKADDGNASDYNNNVAAITAEIDTTPGTDDTPGRLKFFTTNDGERTNTERMRIDRNGKVLIGTTSDATSSNLQVITAQHNARNAYFTHSGDPASAAPYGIGINYSNGAPDNDSNTANMFIYCSDTSAGRFVVAGDGDVLNHDNSYGQISDQRLKTNIVDANSQWDDIKALKVRNFEKKDDIELHGAGKRVQIGVIAQELESAGMNGLVKTGEPSELDIKHSSDFGTLYEDGDTIPEGKKVGDIKTTTGEKVRSVKYSVLYMKAIKALQEAMAKIETLEADVKTLKGE